MNDHTCFKCGADTMESICTDGPQDNYGIQIDFTTGYCSRALWDGSFFQFTVCEKCMKEWMLMFKHRPEHGSYLETPHGQDMKLAPATDHDLRIAPCISTCDKHGNYDEAAQGHLGCAKCAAEA